MSDKLKTVLALLFFVAALIMPLVGGIWGWWRWDLMTGFWIVLGTFAVFFAIGVLIIWSVRDLSWLTTSLPFMFGGLYTIIPDFPLQVDDAAVTATGALLSYALALRKNAGTPKWVIVPLLIAAGYTLIGGPIPGPVDELAVDLVALLVSGIGARQANKSQPADDESPVQSK